MSQTDEPLIIEELIEKLKARHWQSRQEAVEALVSIGEPAVLPLLHALHTPSENHLAVVQVLGRIGDPRAVEPLIETLNTPNFFLTQAAAAGLGNIGDFRAVDPLIDVFRHEWDDTETITTWQEAAKALVAIGEPALLPSLSALNDVNDNVRLWLAEVLGKLADPRANDALLNMLQDPQSQVRAQAAEALGNIGDSRAIEPLTRLLQDQDEQVRLRVCYALGTIAGVKAFDPLVNALRDPDERVRSAAVVNLGRIVGMRIAGIDPASEPERRRTSVESVKNTQKERVIDLLIEALKDPAGLVRAAAARALGRIGDERALPALSWMQQNDKEYAGANSVSDSALRAIQSIQQR